MTDFVDSFVNSEDSHGHDCAHSNIWDLHSSKGCIAMSSLSMNNQEKKGRNLPSQKIGPNEMRGDSKKKKRCKTNLKT